MLAQLTLFPALPKTLNATHLLVLLPKTKTLPKDVPHGELLASVLKRRDMKPEELAKSPVSANAANGALVAWAMLDFDKDTFAQQVQTRKGLQLLLDEQPKVLSIAVSGNHAQRAAELARVRRLGERCAVAGAQEKGRAQGAAKDRVVRLQRQESVRRAQGTSRRQSAVPRTDRAATERVDTWRLPPACEEAGTEQRLEIRRVHHAQAAQDGRGCICCGGAGQRSGRRGHRASYLQTSESQTDYCFGGQGHLLRYRRSQPQALALHAQHA